MEKFNIIVPRGIRYIGEWRDTHGFLCPHK